MLDPTLGSLKAIHTLVINKALHAWYGLRTSGARFHDKLADTLRDMDFMPCRADPDLWLHGQSDHYEYVCVYVDDLMVMMKDPWSFFDEHESTYKYSTSTS